MFDPLAEFPWPAPPDSAAPPRWLRGQFWVGDIPRQVLCYEAGESNWSAELTDLHEEEAGSNHLIDRASRQLAVRSLRAYIPKSAPSPIILDVGCSSGFVLEEIRAALPNAAIIGSDFILPPLQRLAKRVPGLPLLQFDLRACPLPDACVDAVTAMNVLEHIDRDDDALREILRVLRPGGFAHVEVPAGPGSYDVYDEQLMHHRRYRLSELLAKAQAAGFQVLRATHLGCLIYPAFWLVKRNGRRHLTLPAAERKEIVARQIRGTGDHPIMAFLFKVEAKLADVWDFPFGIRCVVVLRKPAPTN